MTDSVEWIEEVDLVILQWNGLSVDAGVFRQFQACLTRQQGQRKPSMGYSKLSRKQKQVRGC